MSLSKSKSRVGKTALALGLGLALAWSVLISGPTGQQASANISGSHSGIVVADGGGINSPPGSG